MAFRECCIPAVKSCDTTTAEYDIYTLTVHFAVNVSTNSIQSISKPNYPLREMVKYAQS
jgi:hypothetical protein